MANELADEVNHEEHDDFDIQKFISELWAYKFYIVIVSFLVICMGMAYVLLTKINSPRTYEYVIQTDFSNREKDQYPNGTVFRHSDIIAPSILSGIYKSRDIAQFEVSEEEFFENFTVSPHTSNFPFIIKKYGSLMSQRGISVAELEELQQRQNTELGSESRRAVVIRYSDMDARLPAITVEEVLKDVASNWSHDAVTVQGVLKVDLPLLDPESLNESSIEGLDPIDGFKSISRSVDVLQQQIREIAQLPSGHLVKDPITKMNTATLEKQLQDIRFRLNRIPVGWSSLATLDQGRPSLNVNLYSPKLFDPIILSDIDYLLALDLLDERVRLLQTDIDKILAHELGGVAIDLVSQLSAYDIQKLILDIEQFEIRQLRAPVLQLGISKDPQVIELFYRSRIAELKRQHKNLTGKSKNLTDSLSNYTRSGSDKQGKSATAESDALQSAGTIIPQFGDAFIDRLINLAEEGGDRQFRQEYSRESVRYLQAVEDINSDISRYEEYIRVFKFNRDENYKDIDVEKYTSSINGKMADILVRLKSYSETLNRISIKVRYSDDLNGFVSQSEENLPKDFYLSPAGSNEDTLEKVIPSIKAVSESAVRIYQQLGYQKSGGAQLLYTPITAPGLLGQSLINKKELFLLLLSVVLGLFLGLVSAIVFLLIRQFKERDAV